MKIVYVLIVIIAVFIVGVLLIEDTNIKGVEDVGFPPNYDIGIYVWESPSNFDNSSISELITVVEKDRFTTLYVSIDEYIDIYELPESRIKTEKLNRFEERLFTLTKIANERSIKVHALAGNPNWVKDTFEYIPPILIDYVADFNRIYTGYANIEGIQFDIEFYNLSDFKKNKNNYIRNYLDQSKDLIGKANNEGLLIGFAVPFWFDGESSEITKIPWEGNDKVPVFHLIDSLNKNERNYVVIMSYRTYASGNDGSIAHLRDEIHYVNNNAPKVSIIAAQDVADGEISKVTFFGKPKSLLKKTINQIAEALSSNALKGFAINDYKHYLDLK